MNKGLPPQEARLSIHPGEWYFGNEYESLYTVLGSCVALSVWHPTLKIGGLCHYLLSAQPVHLRDPGSEGRYGNTALDLLKRAMLRYAALSDYQLGLFGGCDALPNSLSGHTIGKQNVLFAQRWLQDEKLKVMQEDVGGTVSRSLTLEMFSGVISVRHYPIYADS